MDGKSLVPVRRQGQATCVHHRGIRLDWFCEKCKDVICSKCISTLHKGHSIVPLSETSPKNKHKITRFINETEQKELIQIQEELSSTQKNLIYQRRHFKSLAKTVKRQIETLKEKLDILMTETLSKLKHLENENIKLLTSYKTELERKLAELKDQLNQCKEALQTGTDIQVFDVAYSLHTNTSLPRSSVLGTAKFSPNRNPFKFLTDALGEISLCSSAQLDGETANSQMLTRSSDQRPKLTDDSIQLACKVLSKWVVPCDIMHICPASNGHLWTFEFSGKTLTQLTTGGKVKRQIECPVIISNICASPSRQNLWACSEEDNSIRELKSGALDFKFSTNDTPLCLCATRDGHVMIGMKHRIIKYTRGGKVQLTATPQSVKPLVCSPRRISECPISENLVVLDKDLSFDCKADPSLIIVMNKDLHELYRYGREESACGIGLSNICDVAYDSLGQLVVADYENDCLHLLSGDGQYLGLLISDLDCVRSVCVDNKGVLSVAFGSVIRPSAVKQLQITKD